ncbi:hypothetical protein HK097_004379, partial [Rhizophlyctis rosea]
MSTPPFAHVSHILVAEFDIDKGSSLSYQYPNDTGTDPAVLAELMLPDGAHLREEDWTMFFLNQCAQNTSGDKQDASPDAQSPLSDDKLAIKPTITLTLFELDSRHSSHTSPHESSSTWKSITATSQAVLSFEDEFSLGLWTDDGTSRLCEIEPYETTYYRPAPLEVCLFLDGGRTFGFRFDDEDDEIFFLKYMDMNTEEVRQIDPPPPAFPPAEPPLLHVLNLVRTKQIAGARRGARVKAMAVTSRQPWVHVFKPLLVLALEKFFLTPNEQILAGLYRSINAMDLSCMPRLSLLEKTILRNSDDAGLFADVVREAERKGWRGGEEATRESGERGGMGPGGSGKNKDGRYFETKVDYDGIKIPMRIPLACFPEEIGE